jgi:hypothetical protein
MCPLLGGLVVVRDKQEQDNWVRHGRWRAGDPSVPCPERTVSDIFFLSPSLLPHIPRIQQQHIPIQMKRDLWFLRRAHMHS